MSVLALIACGDAGPDSGPGVLEARVVSSGGPDGAVLVEFADFVEVVGAGDATVLTGPGAENRRFLIVLPAPGEVRIRVAVADTTQPPGAAVLQASDGDDGLRSDLAAYAVEWLR